MPTLNRRGFLQSLSAAGLVPMLPAIPAAAPATHTSIQYVWASYYAQMNNACSVPQIMSALNVSPDVAQSLMRRLIDMNVLTPPGATGVAQLRKRSNSLRGAQGHEARINAKKALNLDALMCRVTRNIAREATLSPRMVQKA